MKTGELMAISLLSVGTMIGGAWLEYWLVVYFSCIAMAVFGGMACARLAWERVRDKV